jgi:hypothetical protein
MVDSVRTAAALARKMELIATVEPFDGRRESSSLENAMELRRAAPGVENPERVGGA